MADSQRKSYNLFNKDNADIRQCYVWNDRNYVATSQNTRSVILACKPNTTYTVSKTLSNRFALAYTNTNPTLSDDTPAYGIVVGNDAKSLTITTGGSAQYLVIFFIYIPAETKTVEEIVATIMVNEGQTAKPYEPYGWVHSLRKLTTSTDTITTLPAVVYADGNNATVGLKGNMSQTGTPTPQNPITPSECGDLETSGAKAGQYKIPISSAGQTTPIYLGEVETTRRVKKLVLTGEEIIIRDREREGSWQFFTEKLISTKDSTGICSHFEYIGTDAVNNSDNIGFSIFNNTQFGCRCPKSIANTATDFKSYLAQQYANGTPVTIWYVLATETTGIVNEPIRKIGDYADTVSGISIPTTAGANTITVDTTVQPSEFTATWTGWHDASVKEWDGSDWQ